MTEDKPIQLSAWERAVLDRFLDMYAPDQPQLREQIAQCSVLWREELPASLYVQLDVPASLAMQETPTSPLDLAGYDADGVEIDLMLFLRDGRFAAIEALRVDSRPIQKLPAPDTLH
jgi:hypothetical protein